MTDGQVSWWAGAIASLRSGSSELRVQVLGDEIIVILPATSYGLPTTSRRTQRTFWSRISCRRLIGEPR